MIDFLKVPGSLSGHSQWGDDVVLGPVATMNQERAIAYDRGKEGIVAKRIVKGHGPKESGGQSPTRTIHLTGDARREAGRMISSSALVVDVNVAAQWGVQEFDSPIADLLLDDCIRADRRILSPSWFSCELANLLHRRSYASDPSQHLTSREVEIAYANVLAIVTVVPEDPGLSWRAIRDRAPHKARPNLRLPLYCLGGAGEL